jgi:hypothetical protein
MERGGHSMLKPSFILSLIFFSAAALADVKPLPPSQWPTTVADAVPPVVAILTPTTRSIIRGTPKENLVLFQDQLGEDIRVLLGLKKGNVQLKLYSMIISVVMDVKKI